MATAYNSTALNHLLCDMAPDVIVLRTPHMGVLQWARKHRVPTLPVFADIIPRPRGLRSRFKTWSLRKALMDDIFPGVANHSLNASLSLLHNLRLPAARILPWDRTPISVNPSTKNIPEGRQEAVAFYAGALSEEKGVGDCLKAIHLLKTRNIRLSFRFAGGGDTETWVARARELGIDGQVAFLGLISNQVVRDEMRACDMVIVPSRHGYAEGLPNTLCEGLASRTPVIISDHPAFASRLRHGSDALIFKAASAPALADSVQQLVSNPELYSRLSTNSEKAYRSLFFGTIWEHLIALFLDDPTNQTGWVAEHSLEKLQHKMATTGSAT